MSLIPEISKEMDRKSKVSTSLPLKRGVPFFSQKDQLLDPQIRQFQYGYGRGVVDFSSLPGYKGMPAELEMVDVELDVLSEAMDSDQSCRTRDLRRLTKELKAGKYDPEFVDDYVTDLTPLTVIKKPETRARQLYNKMLQNIGKYGRAAAVLTLTAIFAKEQLQANAQIDPQNSLVVYDDSFGAELFEDELVDLYPRISAIDSIKDANGDTVMEITARGNTIYKAAEDPATNKWPKPEPVYQFRPGVTITSIASFSQSERLAVGYEGNPTYGKVVFFYTADGDKNYDEVFGPAGIEGTPTNLTVIDNSNIWGEILGFEKSPDQIIFKRDLVAKENSIKTVKMNTVTAVDMGVGSLRDSNMRSLDTNKQEFTLASTLYLKNGYAISAIDYNAGIGTAQVFTQTIMNGILYDLPYLYGTGIYTDTLGNPRLVTGNYNRVLFDINLLNPMDGSTTMTDISGLCNNKGILDLIPNSLEIMAINFDYDSQGNRITQYGGAFGSTKNYSSRSIIVEKETGLCTVIGPEGQDKISAITRQQDMERAQFNGQKVTRIFNGLAKIVLPDGGRPHFIMRGLDAIFIPPTPGPTPSPESKKVFIPVVFGR